MRYAEFVLTELVHCTTRKPHSNFITKKNDRVFVASFELCAFLGPWLQPWTATSIPNTIFDDMLRLSEVRTKRKWQTRRCEQRLHCMNADAWQLWSKLSALANVDLTSNAFQMKRSRVCLYSLRAVSSWNGEYIFFNITCEDWVQRIAKTQPWKLFFKVIAYLLRDARFTRTY